MKDVNVYKLDEIAFFVDNKNFFFFKDSKVDRSELFLATKCWPTDYGKEKIKVAAKESCKRLGVDYLGNLSFFLFLIAFLCICQSVFQFYLDD